jgi:hypothetical protein
MVMVWSNGMVMVVIHMDTKCRDEGRKYGFWSW